MGDDNVQDGFDRLGPSDGLFGRLMALIDRLLMSSARVAIRNGDLIYFGL